MRGDVNVLLSSAGRRHALLEILRRTLTQLGVSGRVLATDMTRLSAAFQAADNSFVVPRCTSPEFIPVMLDICREERVTVVVPTIDTELPLYAAHREEFAEIGTTVLVSSPEVVEIGGNKDRTHGWLVSHGIPTVRQASVAEAIGDPDSWPVPLVVKPICGSSSVGVSVVHDKSQLESSAYQNGYIVQSVAPGEEYTIDFLALRDGQCRCAVPRRRMETRAGEVSKGMTVRDVRLQELAARVCHALPGAYGCLNCQVFLDATTGTLNVIEINPRFGGGFPLTWEAGAHFPRWIVEEILGLRQSVEANSWRDRLLMLRYDEGVFLDASRAGV